LLTSPPQLRTPELKMAVLARLAKRPRNSGQYYAYHLIWKTGNQLQTSLNRRARLTLRTEAAAVRTSRTSSSGNNVSDTIVAFYIRPR
jgi:hypothetical protein